MRFAPRPTSLDGHLIPREHAMDANTTTLAAGRWHLISSLTSVGFAVRNFGVRTVLGQFPVRDAWFEVEADGRPTRVHATLDVAGVDTGNERRDLDLRKPRLLDAARHPALTFDGGPAHPVGATRWELPGRLHGHGATTDLVIHVESVHVAPDHVTVIASAQLDRRALGVRAPRLLIGNRVTVSIHAAFAVPVTSWLDDVRTVEHGRW